jgi:hypothetical protein
LPVAELDTKPSDSLHWPDSCRQLWTLQAGICSFVGEPAHGSQVEIDGRRSIGTLFQMDPVTKHDDSIEGQSGLETIPVAELIDGVLVGTL